VLLDVVVFPEIEGELHRTLIVLAEERLDVDREADRLTCFHRTSNSALASLSFEPAGR
jgi:hypothetical protein